VEASVPGSAARRRLVAVLSADVAGYSRLVAQDDAGTLVQLVECRSVVTGYVRQHRGRVVDAVGDALLAEFASAVDAVAGAIAIQDELARRNASVPAERKMELRVGVHLGDVAVAGGELYGNAVNVAARLQALAAPGGICISEEVRHQVSGRLPAEAVDLGEQNLKNIPERVRAHRLHWSASAGPATGAAVPVPGFSGRPAIAVLAFDALGADPEQAFLADGVVEDLITRLSALRLFPVIARNSSFVYRGRAVDVRQAGHELGARYVVEGSVRRAGERIRISAQLIDATTGHHVWAQHYDRALSDLFSLQDEIVDTLAGAIEPEVVRSEQQKALRPTTSFDAWCAFQRGWWHLEKLTKGDLVEARRFFQEAAELDPRFGPARSGLAVSHIYELISQWSDSPAHSLAAAFRAAGEAVSLEDDWLAHVAMGMTCSFARQPERAVAAFEHALAENPSSAVACHGLGFALTSLGQPREGAAMTEKAIRLSPRDPRMHEFLFNLGMARFVAGRHADAADLARRSLEGGADLPRRYRLLAAALAELGELEAARGALAEMARLEPQFSLEAMRRYVSPAIAEPLAASLCKAGWQGP